MLPIHTSVTSQYLIHQIYLPHECLGKEGILFLFSKAIMIMLSSTFFLLNMQRSFFARINSDCLYVIVLPSSLSYYQMYNSVDNYWSYCGEMMWPFDPHTHICCKGYVRPLLGPWYLNKCCGTLNYNRRTHWCCSGKIRRNFLHSASARPRCCGRYSYNPLNQTCCNGVVTGTKVPSYIPSTCCGRMSYDPFKNTCCNGQIQKLVGGFRYTDCCGERSVNTRKQKCCGGVIRHTAGVKNAKCCGKILIDESKEKCCHQGKAVMVSVWKNCPDPNEINQNLVRGFY